MFPSQAFSREWLQKQALKMAKCDPQLLEKSLYALTLLGHLQEAGLPLTFRGGTSLMLHLPDIHRLSIDIDIVSPATGRDLEQVLEEVATKSPFTGMEEDVRDGDRLPKRRHFKFTYATALSQWNDPPYVMLDVVEERDVTHTLEEKPITTGFLVAEREVKVRLPTLESLLGDKLTAFAPRTTGVPLLKADGTPGNVMQVVKQLFDIGTLFDHASNGVDVATTYLRTQAKEAAYREGNITPDATLADTIATCLAATPTKLKFQNSFTDYSLLKSGFQKLRGHLTKKFTDDDFRRMAAQTASVAAHIKNGTPLEFSTLRYASTAEQIAASKAHSYVHTPVDWLDGLKQINPAAFHYWLTVEELIGIVPGSHSTEGRSSNE